MQQAFQKEAQSQHRRLAFQPRFMMREQADQMIQPGEDQVGPAKRNGQVAGEKAAGFGAEGQQAEILDPTQIDFGPLVHAVQRDAQA